MTPQKAEPSALGGFLGIVVIVVALGASAYYGLGWGQRKSPSEPPSIVMNSALLNADLPGTAPFPGGGNRESALEGVLNAARSFNMACTTNQELYLVTDEITALDALNKAIEAQSYQRKTLLTTDKGVMFSLHGPKDLFVTDAGSAIFICEI